MWLAIDFENKCIKYNKNTTNDVDSIIAVQIIRGSANKTLFLAQ